MIVLGYVENEDGSKRCPTEICNAVCCRTSSYEWGAPIPCPKLLNNECTVHGTDKPKGCAEYPLRQGDVDHINKLAEEQGFTERCQLVIIDG